MNHQFEKEKKKKELLERRRYPLEQRLREHIVGQEGPILTVAAGLVTHIEDYLINVSVI